MSSNHAGNLLNQVTFEEHDGNLNAKKVSLVSGATIYAVVNTSSGGNVTLDPGSRTGIVGNVTLDDGSLTGIVGNLTLSDSKGFIGLTTVVQASSARTITGNLTLSDSKGFIGLTTVVQANSARTITGNLTLSDSKGFIGLVTLGGGTANIVGNVTVQAVNLDIRDLTSATDSVAIGSGNVTVQAVDLDIRNLSATQDNVAIIGNVTLSDSKGYIGLVTVTQASSARTITGNLTLSDSKGFIGLTTTTLGASPQFIGIVTVANASFPVTQSGTWDEVGINDSGNSITIDGNVGVIGNVTLSDSKGFIGLVTVGNTVSTTFAGNVTLDAGSKTQIVGNITLSDPKGFIGLVTIVGSLSPAAGNVTLDAGSKTQIVGNITLSDPKGFIGLVTVVGSLSPAAGNVTLDAGSKTQIVGNLTLSDPKGFIGLVTVVGSLSPAAGNVTLDDGSLVGLVAGINGIGFATVNVAAGPAFIGIVTVANASFPVTQSGTWDEVGINDSGNSITIDGSVGVTGNVTLSDAKTFIGLVTAIAINGGTTKTLVSLPIGLGQNSIATVAIPTNDNKVNLTQLILNSNVTTEIAIKSGVTYLTGNASLGITLMPGGGFVMNGAPDSPAWIGLPSGAMVVEKRDGGGTVSKIGGSVIYFDE